METKPAAQERLELLSKAKSSILARLARVMNLRKSELEFTAAIVEADAAIDGPYDQFPMDEYGVLRQSLDRINRAIAFDAEVFAKHGGLMREEIED